MTNEAAALSKPVIDERRLEVQQKREENRKKNKDSRIAQVQTRGLHLPDLACDG